MHNYILKNGDKDYPNAKLKFKHGDVTTCTIETTYIYTIIVTHDCNLPRPFSLEFKVQESNGLWEVDGSRMYIGPIQTTPSEFCNRMAGKIRQSIMEKFGEHSHGTGHEGMDFFVINAFVESAKQNIAPLLDTFDTTLWSALTPLSKLSIENNGEP